MTSGTRKRVLAAAAATAVVLAGGAIAANATIGADDDEHETSTENAMDDQSEDAAEGPDQPITGPDLKTAEQAALDHLGEGRVTGTEVGDEESYYEVEVTLDSGKQVDVQLDEHFNVVGMN